MAAASSDGENDPCLREEVSAGEAPFEHHGAPRTQQTLGVPPPGKVHFTNSRNCSSQFEKPIKVDHFMRFGLLLRAKKSPRQPET
jgi:hypothetical protein